MNQSGAWLMLLGLCCAWPLIVGTLMIAVDRARREGGLRVGNRRIRIFASERVQDEDAVGYAHRRRE